MLADGGVRVAAGPLKLTVPAGELRRRGRADAGAASAACRVGPPRGSRARRRPPRQSPIQTRDNTCDLRGLRVDDGVGMATSFLDRAVGGGQPVVFLLHGHGTGALRDAIRKELARSPYVARFRGGEPDQGGRGRHPRLAGLSASRRRERTLSTVRGVCG